MTQPLRRSRSFAKWAVYFSLILAVVSISSPVIRACHHVQASYNEGWNVFTADMLTQHEFLYRSTVDYRGVNYPMLSFGISAAAHFVTHDYIYTARFLSLAALIVLACLVSKICQELGTTISAGAFAGCYLICAMCLIGYVFVGCDDPNVLALPFFAAGLLLYIRDPDSYLNLFAVAVWIGVGACIKHNPLEFPLAIGVHLAFRSFRRALWFSLCLGVLGVIALLLHVHFGGPGFIKQMTLGRSYSKEQIAVRMRYLWKLLLPTLIVATWTAISTWKNRRQRIAVVFLLSAVAVNTYFSGGSGVSINIFFGTLIAFAIQMGLFFDRLQKRDWTWATSRWILLFPLLMIGFLTAKQWRNIETPWQTLASSRVAEREELADEAMIRAQPGPAICSEMLQCFNAGKPYLYDPFNARRFVDLHLVTYGPLIQMIEHRQLGAIEELATKAEGPSLTDNPSVREAIQQNYFPAVTHPDGITIYVPRK